MITGAGNRDGQRQSGVAGSAALVAPSVTVEVPAAVGVPEISPVAVLTDKPAGNPVAL